MNEEKLALQLITKAEELFAGGSTGFSQNEIIKFFSYELNKRPEEVKLGETRNKKELFTAWLTQFPIHQQKSLLVRLCQEELPMYFGIPAKEEREELLTLLNNSSLTNHNATNSTINDSVRFLVFGSSEVKPDFIIRDLMSGHFELINTPGGPLGYDKPISDSGLKWQDLIKWWTEKHPRIMPTKLEDDLYNRLRESLSSPPEKLLFDTYYRELNSVFKNNLPALIPQVYVKHDPYTKRELGGQKRLNMQRVDFLILFSNQVRIILEVDGKQHYADNEDKASPEKYADMVASDRELRLRGYEVYRFGGYELYGSKGELLIKEFFQRLLAKYNVSKV